MIGNRLCLQQTQSPDFESGSILSFNPLSKGILAFLLLT